jgi:peptide/nickel transport system substrate-binding protein
MSAGGLYARTLGASAGNGRRYFKPASSGLRSLILNTTHGPLRDVRLRQAIALAVDRSAVARIDGGLPAAGMITPGVPGYVPRTPVASLRRARALVGKRRVHVALYTYEGVGGDNQERARLIRTSLAAVGIDVSVKIAGDPWSFARRPNSPVDILLDGWVPDYLDPAGILNELLDPDLLGSGLYPAFFTDAHWLARLRAAAKVTGARRPAVYERLDRRLALGPTPTVPLAFMAGTAQLFSKRVGCHTFLPQYSGLVDFASLCLK